MISRSYLVRESSVASRDLKHHLVIFRSLATGEKIYMPYIGELRLRRQTFFQATAAIEYRDRVTARYRRWVDGGYPR